MNQKRSPGDVSNEGVEPCPWNDIFLKRVWRGDVRFTDLDAMGMVNYGTYLHFVDDAVLTWWQQLPLDFKPSPSEFGIVTVAANCVWMRPVSMRCSLESAIGVDRIGTKSFQLLCALRKVGDAEPCFAASLTQVYFRDGESTRLDASTRSELEKRRLGDCARDVFYRHLRMGVG